MRAKYIVLAVLITIFIILVIIDGKRKVDRRRESALKESENLQDEETVLDAEN